MIRDRGRIKWVSMMLPEHVKVLREWAEEDSYETKKELDEQQLEIMNEIITEAMEFDKQVTIIHFRERKYELLVGRICSCDSLNSRLHVIDRFGEEHRIEWQNIMEVQHAG
ncbi:YolD-like family protein [Bacillus tuaregi]|uniref:YolD-like family protein n=1 Tax=Bacillus tuaregi TaxID=1816695 RepID=UPI0008F930E6|nr:YolD-like family protein [Bacillus tuaregi]